MTEKSILEQALLQVQTLEEAVKQNAKGILASTMKEELNELLKESEEEVQKDEEMSEGDVAPVKDDEMSEESNEEENDMSEQPEDEADDEEAGEEGGEENIDDLDNEDPMKDIDSMDSEGGMDSEDEMPVDDEMGMDDEMGSDDDVMDMTGASDDEVLRVFKAMKPEDGIVVKKDGGEVSLDMDGEEYIIKLDEEEGESEVAEEDEVMEDETIYEIELDEEDDVEVEASEGEEEPKEVEATEAARTKWNPHGGERSGIKSKKMFKAGAPLNEEVENLKKQNAEYKKALVLFKEKLNEVAVFNANLAYATRLFTEHSTTKQEKLNILKRFDSVSTMNESKTLFSTIKSELETKKPVTESVVEKISATPQSSSSQEVLSEAKAYENPQFKRMKDLMGKLK